MKARAALLVPLLFAPLLFAGAVLALAAPARAAEPPRVVASIAPLHSLVAAVMDGVGTPHLLVPRQASPHDYTLKPSDARALDGAAAVFWIGDSLEAFLEHPIAALASRAVVVAAEEVKGVTVLPAREGGPWEAHVHGHDEHGHDEHEKHAEHEKHEKHAEHAEHKDHDDHGHHGEDPHLWLSPANAKALLAAIAETLAGLDPERAATYRANAARAAAAVDAAAADAARDLGPVADRPYVVFHDAYQYFERHFGTHAVGSVSLSDARKPGARRVREIRAKLVESGAVCLFAEPQFDDRLVHTLIEGTDVRTGVLDPLGSHIAEGPGHYPALLRSLAKALAACLK
ncbi:MAG: zinc ABC transporter substrate-binding protein [Hyphomicrobiales bacterium]|nr:zinc ABC transporter substrate-binding protein [Hyphomicrobiales bacterium]MCP5371009.1 zinc ABC transporter substrate-binding protein [Hyphomicrobiales bacterium]